ncbi:MAG: NUDIX domain-containing protein [Bacteroidales bacterium]|nr:NUDIX domain-containing protein [Bacteroidales bacterium]
MHKIYFEKRCICICTPADQQLSNPNAVTFCPGDRDGIHALVNMVEASESLGMVYVPAEDPEDMYRKVCAEFVEVTAGGGLVSNRRGDYLLIRRNGLWDLPKGHLEPGEDIEECSMREVREETGVNELSLRGLICVTDHCYRRAGMWHLKHTWWYDMLYTDPTDLTPQLEEDIAKAAWVAKSSLPAYLTNTYPSIQEVFREAN